MIVLSFETTSNEASVALVTDEEVLGTVICDPSQKHAQTVLPALETLLEKTKITFSDIDAIAVDIGPGSFTGVRIGTCIANAFAFAHQKPMIAVDSLRALYRQYRTENKTVCSLVDARNGNAYAAVYRNDDTVVEPCAVVIEPFAKALGKDVVFIGDVEGLCTSKQYPTAVGVAKTALLIPREEWKREAHPLYLRPSQAERLAGERR